MKLRDLKLGEEFKYPRSEIVFRKIGVSLEVGHHITVRGLPETVTLIYNVVNHVVTVGHTDDKVILHETT